MSPMHSNELQNLYGTKRIAVSPVLCVLQERHIHDIFASIMIEIFLILKIVFFVSFNLITCTSGTSAAILSFILWL